MDSKFFCGLFEGDGPNGCKLGMGLTGGDFWPRLNGCQNLYRGVIPGEIDFASIVNVSDTNKGTITVSDVNQHDSLKTYYYVLRRANHCGNEERSYVASRIVEFGDNGNYIGKQCNGVVSLYAEQVSCNMVNLGWYYCPVDQEDNCKVFNVYSGNGTCAINYGSIIKTVTCTGKGYYSVSFEVPLFSEYKFSVKTVIGGDVESFHERIISLQISRSNPESVIGISIANI